jgi:amino acid transporter
MAIIQNKKKLGSDSVFLTAFLIFSGPVLFLRLGFCVGTLGFLGTLCVIAAGTVLSLAFSSVITEFTSNQRSVCRNEYFMISRSFGINISASVGIALYLVQLLSVAYFVIAFTESFLPLFSFLGSKGITFHPQYIGIPCILILLRLQLKGGVQVKQSFLYFLVLILFVAVVFLFLGHTEYGKENTISLFSLQKGNLKESFFSVFSIFFSAFVGITASVGLSDRLKDPGKAIQASLPKAILISMILYGFVALKLAVSATPDDLVNNPLIFSNIALMGSIIIPVALALIALPLAIQSLSLAPKTLQALADDNLLPFRRLNDSMAKVKGKLNKPYNAALFTSLIVFFFVLQGELNVVAKIITILLLVCYGSISILSFLHHFTADPSYQPTKRTAWQVPLIGFFLSIVLLFGIKFYYALTALAIVWFIYLKSNRMNNDRTVISAIFRSIGFQFSRSLQVFLQKQNLVKSHSQWRPSIICLSEKSAENDKSFRFIEWISYRYGFGTYIYLVDGIYSKVTHDAAQVELKKMVIKSGRKSKVYFDTFITSSFTSALNHLVQYPGVNGMPNNIVLFEFDREKIENVQKLIESISLMQASKLELCILGTVNRPFKFRNGIQIWIRDSYLEYSNLAIILASIIHDHPVWKNGKILFNILVSKDQMEESAHRLKEIVHKERLPVALENLDIVVVDENTTIKEIICEKSVNTGLSIICYSIDELRADQNLLYGYETLGDILFVNASELKEIS